MIGPRFGAEMKLSLKNVIDWNHSTLASLVAITVFKIKFEWSKVHASSPILLR